MQTATVMVGSKSWSVQVATTSAERAQGLGGVASIPAYTGMLFDLGSRRIVTVNSYEMLFPIAIVFIDEDMKVTEFSQQLPPGDEGTTSVPCRFFMEVNVGEISGIVQGDLVTFTGYTPTTTSSIISLMMTMMIVTMMMKMMMQTMKGVK